MGVVVAEAAEVVLVLVVGCAASCSGCGYSWHIENYCYLIAALDIDSVAGAAENRNEFSRESDVESLVKVGSDHTVIWWNQIVLVDESLSAGYSENMKSRFQSFVVARAVADCSFGIDYNDRVDHRTFVAPYNFPHLEASNYDHCYGHCY